MKSSHFSLVLLSRRPWKLAQAYVVWERLLFDVPHEIIVIHDAASFAEGYNRALTQSRGDIILFVQDDVTILDPGFAKKITRRMRDWDLLGLLGAQKLTDAAWYAADWPQLQGAVATWSPGTAQTFTLDIFGMTDWPVTGGIRVLDGTCIITHRDVARIIGFDAAAFDGPLLWDCDFSSSVAKAQYKVGVCCDIPFISASSRIHPTNTGIYGERFLAKHLGGRKQPFGIPLVRSVETPDLKNLFALWNEATFRRATIGLARNACSLAA